MERRASAESERRAARRRRRAAAVRRRRFALGLLIVAAAGAFALGAALGDGPDRRQRPPLASTLAAPQLAGQRLLAGFEGTEVPPALRRAVRRGALAGVV